MTMTAGVVRARPEDQGAPVVPMHPDVGSTRVGVTDGPRRVAKVVDPRVPDCSLVDGFLRPAANPVAAGARQRTHWLIGGFGARQGARFTCRSVAQGDATIVLKASGGTMAAPARCIEVCYRNTPPGGDVQVVVLDRHEDPADPWRALAEPWPLALGDGDSLVAIADETGTITVVVVTRSGPSWVGAVTMSERHPLRLAGGRIGVRLAPMTGVDNVAGGDVA
jgi:hypothetical protein